MTSRPSAAVQHSPPEKDSWWDRHQHSVLSGLLSFVLHAALLGFLACLVLPLVQFEPEFLTLQTVVVDNAPLVSYERLDVQPVVMEDAAVNNLAVLPVPVMVESLQPSPIKLDVNDEQLTARIEALKFLGQPHPAGEFSGRTEQARTLLAKAFGGSASTENAVHSGLRWLADHQRPDGSWNFDHRHAGCDGNCSAPGQLPQATVAATSLALLCYLGAGQTHRQGEYRAQVERGLRYLLQKGAEAETPGDYRELPSHNSAFYTQGLAAMALCECYGMTGDRTLLKPAQQAIDFIIASQHPEAGGWRYRLGQEGDTSVVGWNVMALASAGMSRIAVPARPKQLSMRFLDSVQLEQGAYYGYNGPEQKPSTTAVGLLCRMYLGWNRNRPGLKAGCEYLSQLGPSRDDMYYNYYATQVLHHYGGPEWERWNVVMREQLLSTQVREGHAAGSWAPRDRHGGGPGGRHYMTCLAVLTLEVYYRHLPLYQKQGTLGQQF